MKIFRFAFFFLSGVLFFSAFTFASGQKVIIDPVKKMIFVQSGDQLISREQVLGMSGTNNDFSLPPQPIVKKDQPSVSSPEKPNPLLMELQQGSELEKAIYRMYHNGLTKYEKLSDYRPEDPLLREEAAKIIGQAYTLLGFSQEVKNSDCLFADREQFDPSLTAFIEQTCKLAVFKGSQGKFYPRKALSKAEALTVLIRILEGKSSSEAFQPWRMLYFAKAKGISLTQETEVMALERPITRKEIALLVHRFKTIILNTQLKTAAKDQLSTIEKNPDAFLKPTQTSTQQEKSDPLNAQSTTSKKDNEILGIVSATGDQQTSSLSILNSPEVNEAIQWMHDHGMTSAKEIAAYQPFAPLTREQSAKMFAQFAKTLAFSPISGAKAQCQFKDLQQGDSSLRSSIAEVCQLGLMQGDGGVFSPKTELTKAQFITMLIRLSEGKRLNENENPRWIQYFLKAKEL